MHVAGTRKTVAVAGMAAAVGLSAVTACSSGQKPSAGPASTTTTTVTSTPPRSTAPSSSPTPPSDFGTAYAREHDGVVNITTRTCGDTGTGSGFLVAPNLVATAGHVVAGETGLSITDPVGGGTVSGRVVGYDAAQDVALIQTATPLTGYAFSFATADPQVGSRIAAIGYPLNGPESLATGTVSGLDRTVTVQSGGTRSHLIQIDAPINPGNSGGPMIALDGSVEGIADASNIDAQGINYAVSASVAAPLINRWRQNPNPVPPATCQAPTAAPAPTPKPTTSTPTPSAPSSSAIDAAVATLNQYMTLINDHDYADAYALISPADQQRLGSESHWEQGITGSVYSGAQVVNITDLGGGAFDVELTFTSTQPGKSCKVWDLDYTLIPASGGAYLIDKAAPHNGGSGFTPC